MATFSILTLALPGRTPKPAGVLLFDAENGQLGVKLRRDWDDIAEPEDAEILSSMESHLKQISNEMGASRALEFLESSLANVLQLGERNEVGSGANDFTLHQLYRQYVPTPVRQFVTHLPRYALRSAAGGFGEQIANPNEVIDWVEAPEGLRLTRDMFVCEVYGRSMEPLVPSGSLCVFRKFGAGSRENKRVLVEDRHDPSERYTLKVYHSRKVMTDEGWTHQSIELFPLNPEFPVLHLEADQDRYAVIAEFVALV
jgi:phage repressor protein C with HTH and peptisase S24 domain